MTGLKKRGALFVLLLAFALIAAACSSDSDDTTTTAAETTTTAAETTTTAAGFTGTPVLTCLVTDTAGVDDQSFNQSAWEGVQQAMEQGFADADSTFLESDAAEDWQANIDTFVNQGCEHIVTVGFFLGGVTETAAAANPEIKFTMIDNVLSERFDNVRELVYQTDEAAFAAGYLAAGMSQSGVIGTYGGANIPTVSIFLDGYARGAAYYNEMKDAEVQVIGWDIVAQDGLFTGSFSDMVLARDMADSLFQEGVDMIIPVGGAINLPAGDAIIAGELDAALIGVDADAFFAMDAKYQDLWLTTVEKKIKVLVAFSVQEHAEGTWTAGSFKDDLTNGGVGLAEFHSWDGKVSAELKAEVFQILEDIKSGTITWDKIKVGA